jgi:hypothetical protein
MATTRDSTLYTKLHVNKYLGDARDRGGRVVPIPFEHTVVTGETGGASAGVQDLVNLCVLPANCMVVGFVLVREALGASAGAGVNLRIGDSGDDDRYMAITDSDAAGAIESLAFTGQNYKPTADAVVQGKWSTANPVVGKIFRGTFLVVPGA